MQFCFDNYTVLFYCNAPFQKLSMIFLNTDFEHHLFMKGDLSFCCRQVRLEDQLNRISEKGINLLILWIFCVKGQLIIFVIEHLNHIEKFLTFNFDQNLVSFSDYQRRASSICTSSANERSVYKLNFHSSMNFKIPIA